MLEIIMMTLGAKLGGKMEWCLSHAQEAQAIYL